MASYKISAFVSVTLSAVAVSVIMPILAPIARVVGLTEIQVGIIVSVGSAVMAIAGAMWGRLSDRIGRQPIMAAGFAGVGVTYIVYTWLTWLGMKGALTAGALFLSLVASRAAIGVFLPAVPAAAQALVADNTTEEERSTGMALIGAANGLGMVIGPVMGGALAILGLIWPLFATVVVSLLALVFVLLWVPRSRPVPRIADSTLSARALWRWLLAAFVVFGAIITMQVVAGFYIQDSLGLTEAETAPVLAGALFCVGLAMILMQIVQIKWLKWAPRPLMISGAALWIAGFVCLLATATEPLYYLSYAVLGIGNGLLFPGVIAGASLNAGADHQGGVAGLIAAAQGSAAIITPLGSTVLYHAHPEWPFYAAGAGMVVLILLFSPPSSAALKR